MSKAERRRILEEIARDEANYPRDRIMAVRALRDLDTPKIVEKPAKPVEKPAAPSVEDELDSLIRTK